MDEHILYSNPDDPFELFSLYYPLGLKGASGEGSFIEAAHADLVSEGYEFDGIYKGSVLNDAKSFPTVIKR